MRLSSRLLTLLMLKVAIRMRPERVVRRQVAPPASFGFTSHGVARDTLCLNSAIRSPIDDIDHRPRGPFAVCVLGHARHRRERTIREPGQHLQPHASDPISPQKDCRWARCRFARTMSAEPAATRFASGRGSQHRR